MKYTYICRTFTNIPLDYERIIPYSSEFRVPSGITIAPKILNCFGYWFSPNIWNMLEPWFETFLAFGYKRKKNAQEKIEKDTGWVQYLMATLTIPTDYSGKCFCIRNMSHTMIMMTSFIIELHIVGEDSRISAAQVRKCSKNWELLQSSIIHSNIIKEGCVRA